MEDGHHCGQLFQKLPNNAENSLNATARNAVLDTVTVTRPTLSVQCCAIAVDNALNN